MATPAGFIPFATTTAFAAPFYVNIECDYRGGLVPGSVVPREEAAVDSRAGQCTVDRRWTIF